MFVRFIAPLAAIVLFDVAIAHSADSLIVLPREVTLTGPEARQTLLVEMADGPLVTGPVRDGVTFKSENEAVAKVVDRRVVPIGNGSTTFSVTANGQTAMA